MAENYRNNHYEDSVAAFAECKDKGLVDHVGLSNVTVEQLETAREHVEIATVQNQYNIGNREDEAVLQACEEHNIGFMPWLPLAAGNLGALEEDLKAVADAHDATRYQIALAWLLEHSDVMLPIPGTSSPGHLEENIAASGIELTDEEYSRLTEASE